MMMRRFLIGFCALAAPLALGGCVENGYGGGVAVGYGSPYAYNGFYDDYYGPFYDGYWGGDGAFYYRGSANERHFHRGDPSHFRHDPGEGAHFHAVQGNFTRAPGMRTPHFNGGGNPGGGRHRGG